MQCSWTVAVLCVGTLAAASSAQDGLPWWKTANLYQVYPRSFKDTTGLGMGDLKGVLQKAQYFKDIGLDAIWLSPIFESPMIDFGYDISNFTAIDPVFGTMDDFDALSKKLKELGIKLLLDFVPNHTSDEHEWFKQSLNASNPDYLDFYVWKEANGTDPDGNPRPPNNWLSMFGGSAWEWREERKMFYLHQFSKKQPDLNFRSERAKGNVTAILSYWMDKGVDGFRLDAVKHIFENGSFPNERVIFGNGSTYFQLEHIYETDQPETYDLMKLWADLIEDKVKQDGVERVLFPEVYDPHNMIMRYYKLTNDSRVIPFNFDLLTNGSQAARSTDMKNIIDSWMNDMPAGYVANWVVGNHDNLRIADRYGPEMVDAINLLGGVLPGIKVTYYGEEIGMADTYVRDDQTVDKSGVPMGTFFTRDPARTPMQWDSTPSAGFSTNLTTWLPVNPNYWWLNVEAQKAAENSHLKVFQAMSKARKDLVLRRGGLNVLAPDNDTLVVIRQFNGSSFALVINMGSSDTNYTSQNLFQSINLDINMTVVTSSINCVHKVGAVMKEGSISLSLRPKAAVLLRSVDDVPSSKSSSFVTRAYMLAPLLAVFATFLAR